MEHIELITEEFVETLMFHTLTVKVMGMIESKKKVKKPKLNSGANSDCEDDMENEADDDQAATQRGSFREKNSKAATVGDESSKAELARQNAELRR